MLSKLSFMMKCFLTTFFLIITLWINNSILSQNIGELKNKIENSHGEERAKAQLELATVLISTDPLKSIDYAQKAEKFGVESEAEMIEGNARLVKGYAFFHLKEYNNSFEQTLKAIKIFEFLDKDRYSTSFELLGEIDFIREKYSSSASYFEKAFEYYKKSQNKKQAAYVSSKIGKCFEEQGKYLLAIEWYSKSYDFYSETKDFRSMVRMQSNLGGVFSNYGDYQKAERYTLNALDLAKKHSINSEIEKLEQRLEIIKKNKESDKYNTTKFDLDQIESKNQKISHFQNRQAKTLEEIEKLSEEKQLIELKYRVQQDEYEKKLLSERLAKLQVEEALKQEKLEKDNLKLALENEKLISEKKTIENHRLILFLSALLIVIGLIIIALIIKIRSNRKLEQKNIQIQKQKSEIEKKQHEINQSIVYATRIQEAILPSLKSVSKYFPSSFVYVQPKNQVSGDFVWTYEQNGLIHLCVADCTGHGVPGAFMSIIFSNILEEVVAIKKQSKSDLILMEVERLLKEKVQDHSESSQSFKDGMDASYIVFDPKKNHIDFAGAKNSIYLIRDEKLVEFKGSKYSIDTTAIGKNVHKKVASQIINLNSGDQLYLFTDGFMDQKGGESNQKFFRQPFKDLIVEFSKESMKKQENLFLEKFSIWKGENEQIDDNLIVGIEFL